MRGQVKNPFKKRTKPKAGDNDAESGAGNNSYFVDGDGVVRLGRLTDQEEVAATAVVLQAEAEDGVLPLPLPLQQHGKSSALGLSGGGGATASPLQQDSAFVVSERPLFKSPAADAPADTAGVSVRWQWQPVAVNTVVWCTSGGTPRARTVQYLSQLLP